MSFYDIKDHKQRDETIKNYLATMERIKRRNMNDRLEQLGYDIRLQDKFKPLLQSNVEMSNEITKDLAPIKKELVSLNETIRKRDNVNRLLQQQIMSSPRRLPETPSRLRSASDPERVGSTAAYYLKKTLTEGNDNLTGIRYDGSVMMMGDKKVELQDENNLKVDGEIYRGTPGLWALITEKKPKEYNTQDLEAYKKLMVQTNAIYQNNDPTTGKAKLSKSFKWKNILAPIWEELKTKDGSGIIFLPKNIKGLWKKLKLLGAEYSAGNKTTHNELVAVLDELKRQGGIAEEEYTAINSSI